MEGFIPHIIGNTEAMAFEYYEAASDTDFSVGQLVKFNADGYLTPYSGGTTKPPYVCMQNYDADVDNGPVCVSRVRPDIIFETHASASFSSIDIGDKVTVADAPSPATYAAGLRATATTTNGVATVLGTAAYVVGGTTIAAKDEANCIVYVKFE